uniref:Uncharacterized protein n=1 Tax=Cebus imitator TaxID=2715852 RepID=A0A2K5QXA0_CEBIM
MHVLLNTRRMFCVHSAGEVRVAVVAPIPTGSADPQKRISNEVLGPGHTWVLSRLGSSILRSSVASKFWKGVLNLRFPSKDFLSEQILLVEEQNHRDGTQPPVVPDALEEVQSLLKAAGLIVVPNDHVVAAAGHHEDDGSHIIEALDPLAAFITLATHVKHVEVDFVHLELRLKDSRSQDAAKQVLVARHIVGLLDHIDLVQEVLGTVNQLVLVEALVAGTHSFILPQSLGTLIEFGREVEVRHVHHTQNVVYSELVLRVGQLHRGHQVARGGHNGFDCLFQVVFDVLHFGCLLTIAVAPCSLRVLFAALSIKPINMQDPHLLHNGAFTRFSSTQQQQAVRGPVDLLVLLQLLLDLFVGLALRLLLVALVLGLTVPEAAHGGSGGRGRPGRGSARRAAGGGLGSSVRSAWGRLLGAGRGPRGARKGAKGRVVSVRPMGACSSPPLERRQRG